MERQCESCGQPFTAKRSTARFCSERCKKRHQRRAASEVRKSAPDRPPGLQQVAAGGLSAAAEARLSAAGRLDGPEGQAVMILAVRIDQSLVSAETGAGVASLVRQFHASLGLALAGAEEAGDPVEDELEAARARRRALAGD